ncbi:oxidative stress-responsive serine-rich protein 1 [Brachionichthys hirsutus]|uniref:oxidative stress-responsive serine-rich protein 1 n=1 Tax=Brachionichthys hirsutus TaxID=412623 RepID=UPI003604479A
MEAGGKDCEEETLQMAFKKLRVDAESLPGAAGVSEATAPRAASWACLDAGAVKSKLGCPKDNWHGCTRKSSRGVSRTQRRRRSKSPILHPPKFTYCSSTAAPAPPPSGCLKQQRLAVSEPGGTSASPSAPGQKDLSSPLAFGSRAGYESRIEAAVSSREVTPDGRSSGDAPSSREGGPGGSACDKVAFGAPGSSEPSETTDFRALSEQGSGDGPHVPCSCAWRKRSDAQEARCRCRSNQESWAGVEVYAFTGLRDVISECERSLPGREDTPRTTAASAPPPPPSPSPSSGSPRSCSEQARASVDDITIEDLSGYMEYYLCIPKKMSHMAEMMYT